jgi:SWI/SNF-related matrix-associated actin-dependent regulator 1 of chromatin subfamily A
VVFAELDWVPGNMSQAEDRCHRIGQTDSVLVQHLVVDKSLDARIAEALVVKQKVLDKALDNVQVIDQSITIKDLALFT